MSELAADFELSYRRGPTIRAHLRQPATGFTVTALYGPSGCGKTTILRALAGLERPQQGSILFGSDVWLDSRRGIHCRPRERNVGFLFQEYALFPHLTVAENVAYSLSSLPSSARKRHVGRLLERFGLIGLERRYPGQISGGQQQRVALARTLARKPGLLLLDEPLSALDAALREQLRLQLRSQLAEFNIPMILVTHDRREAIALADDLVVLDQGRILQAGPVHDVFARPASEQVARMVGVETVERGRVVGRANGTLAVEVGGTILSALATAGLTDNVLVCIRADEVEIAPASAARDDYGNQLPATIRGMTSDGWMVRLDLDCGFPLVALVPHRVATARQLQPRQEVTAHLTASAVHLIPAG